jgi:purine-nucleoside phosphorylase
MNYFDQVAKAAAFLKAGLGSFAPRIGIVLGSGLGAVAESIARPIISPYEAIPNFPQSTVEGHRGRIVAGLLAGVPVVILEGRVHFYEGYSPLQVTFPMRALGVLGVRAVVLTNAAGAIAEHHHVGQLVAIADHINLMGFNPLVGPNEAYSRTLRTLAKKAAEAEGFSLAEGIYLAVSGPSFETPAEIRTFRALGATLVGMSTVPETIVARHMGLEVLGISCVTNLAAGLGATSLRHEDVFATGASVEHRLTQLFNRLLPKMNAAMEPENKSS